MFQSVIEGTNSAQSKDLDPVSVIAEAENKSKTRAYQTVRIVLVITIVRIVLVIQRKLHYKCLAAESRRGPCDDWDNFLTETDCSQAAAHPCT